MDIYLLAAVFGAAFIGNFVKGVSGFGSAVVFVPIASFFLSPAVVIPLSVIMAFAMNLYMTAYLQTVHLAWKNKALAVGLPPGAVIGAHSFAYMPRPLLRYFIVAVLGVIALQELLRVFELTDPPEGNVNRPGWLDGLTSTASGIAGGLFSMAGPIVISYLRLTSRRFELRRLVVPVFALSAGFALGTYYLNGELSEMTSGLILSGLGGAIAGIVTGMPVLHYINERWFSGFVAAFLIVASIGLLL